MDRRAAQLCPLELSLVQRLDAACAASAAAADEAAHPAPPFPHWPSSRSGGAQRRTGTALAPQQVAWEGSGGWVRAQLLSHFAALGEAAARAVLSGSAASLSAEYGAEWARAAGQRRPDPKETSRRSVSVSPAGARLGRDGQLWPLGERRGRARGGSPPCRSGALGRYGGDMGEIWARLPVEVELWGDMGEMWGRYGLATYSCTPTSAREDTHSAALGRTRL